MLDLGGSRRTWARRRRERLPQVIFILVGGIWADRLPRHRVMVVSDALAGAARGDRGARSHRLLAEIWRLVVLQVVRGTADAFFFPAAQGIVPQTVSARLLQEANALLRLSRNGTQIFGAAAGGILVATIGRAGRLHLTRRPTSPARRCCSGCASHAI